MKKWALICGLVAMMVSSAFSWQPNGWVYFEWNDADLFAYEHDTEDWYWFNDNPEFTWVYGFEPAEGWKTWDHSGLAQGWTWHSWPFAYHLDSDTWYYINEHSTQWVWNFSSASWSVLGVPAPDPDPYPLSMVLIPGGTNAGTNPLAEGESYNINAYPETYSLTVESFYMDTTPVTKAQWEEVFAWAIDNGYSFDNAGSGQGVNHPVHSVGWFDVVKWCNARSEKEGRPAVYMVNGAVYRTGHDNNVVQTAAAGYRLPTGVEWEYAARGGLQSKRFPWGDRIDHDKANYRAFGDVHEYDDGPEGGVYHHESTRWTPVDYFPANGYGLYDMSGNVAEFIFDRYAHTWWRVYRGGSWSFDAEGCRIGQRFAVQWNDLGYDHIGFRAVLPPGE